MSKTKVNEKTFFELYEGLSPKFKNPIDSFAEFLVARNEDHKTILRHKLNLARFLTYVDRKDFTFETATREDIVKAFEKINSSDLGEDVKRRLALTIKKYYKHLLGNDETYPSQVSWIKTTVDRRNEKLPEDMLTQQEVIKLINSAPQPRNKAIISLLWDTGIRAGELLNMKVKDAVLDHNPAYIVVSGKTGARRIPIIFSVPYLSAYLNTRPDRKPDEPLWTAILPKSVKRKVLPIDSFVLRKMLQQTTDRAQINKHVHPHLFRHSRATYYANKLTDQQLKAFFGWTKNSGMAATYIHMSGRDLDNAVLKANGKVVEEEQAAPTEKICPNCKHINPVSANFCEKCGLSLNEQEAVRLIQQKEDDKKVALEALTEIIKDPKIKDELIKHLFVELKSKKKWKDAENKS